MMMKFPDTHLALHVKYLVLPYNFKHNFKVSVQLPYIKFIKNVFSGSQLVMYAQTTIVKLTEIFF
jgi:hypothetical protein